MINPRTERKLGRAILELVADMQATPRDNVARFMIIRKKMLKAVERYKEYTGRDNLLPDVDYGYKIKS